MRKRRFRIALTRTQAEQQLMSLSRTGCAQRDPTCWHCSCRLRCDLQTQQPSLRLSRWRNRPLSMLEDEIEDGVGRPDAVDVLAPAGTAIVTNACNIHAGTVRQSKRARRSIILW